MWSCYIIFFQNPLLFRDVVSHFLDGSVAETAKLLQRMLLIDADVQPPATPRILSHGSGTPPVWHSAAEPLVDLVMRNGSGISLVKQGSPFTMRIG